MKTKQVFDAYGYPQDGEYVIYYFKPFERWYTGFFELDGYVLLTIDSEQGWDYQAFFSVDKKVDADKYWDEQEEDEDE